MDTFSRADLIRSEPSGMAMVMVSAPGPFSEILTPGLDDAVVAPTRKSVGQTSRLLLTLPQVSTTTSYGMSSTSAKSL